MLISNSYQVKSTIENCESMQLGCQIFECEVLPPQFEISRRHWSRAYTQISTDAGQTVALYKYRQNWSDFTLSVTFGVK